MAVRQVPAFEAHRFGMVAADPDGQIVEYEEKPKRTRSTMASMGIYVFKREVLVQALTAGPGRRQHNLGGEVIPALVRSQKVYAYPFHSYWADVGTLQAYYEANMALVGETPALDLHNPERVIHTRSEERPAAQLGPEARVEGSLLCDGCQVEGTVINSVISPGVHIAAGAIVRDAILMTDARVEAGAVVDRAIVDKRVTVGAAAKAGRRWRQHAQPEVAGAPQHGHHGRGQTRRHPGGRDNRPQRGDLPARNGEGLSRPRGGERRNDRRMSRSDALHSRPSVAAGRVPKNQHTGTSRKHKCRCVGFGPSRGAGRPQVTPMFPRHSLPRTARAPTGHGR